MKKGVLLGLAISISMLAWAGTHSNYIFREYRNITNRIELNITHWDHEDFPLSVRVDVSSFSQEERECIFSAIEHWNIVIGEPVFQASEIDLDRYTVRGILLEPPRGEVYVQEIELGLSEENGSVLGLTELRVGHFNIDFSQTNNATVFIDNDTSPEDLFVVVVHELGHVLGLGHDRDAVSVMYPYALESGGVIMDDDIEYIREQLRPVFVPRFFADSLSNID